jgi:hypothetical protein
MRHYDEAPPLWNPSPPTTITPPKPTQPETADELPRNTAEVSLLDQNGGGADQHHNKEEDQVVETTPVGDPNA